MIERRFAVGAGLAFAMLATAAWLALDNARSQRALAARAAAEAAPDASATIARSAVACPDGMLRVASDAGMNAFCIDQGEVARDAFGPCVEAGVCNDWSDAAAYCKARGKRLPTDAERLRSPEPPPRSGAELGFRCVFGPS